MRVLKWIIDRCEGSSGGAETEIGTIPRPEDFDLAEIDITRETMRELFSIRADEWKKELEGQSEFFKTLGQDMPQELIAQHDKLAEKFTK
jgi:phosphoenolpyruvate carboxykinase (GTP)